MQHKEQLDAAYVGGSRNSPKSYDYSSYFKNLQVLFQTADLRVANMETCFTKAHFSGYPNFGSPSSLALAAKNGGIDVFLSANNHICDKGLKGLEYTTNLFDSLKIPYTGVFKSKADEFTNNPLMITIKGYKIAILNYTYGTNGMRVPPPYVVKVLDSTIIKDDISRAKLINPDFIIACVHWGYEYKIKNSKEQVKWQSLFNRNGVDIIIGSHPHVPQGINIERKDSAIERITVYSLGNFISNMSAPNTRIGIIFKLNLFIDRYGRKKILEPEYEYIWTTRPNELETNYSVVPISVFKNKKNEFKDKSSYDKMMFYYLQFTK